MPTPSLIERPSSFRPNPLTKKSENEAIDYLFKLAALAVTLEEGLPPQLIVESRAPISAGLPKSYEFRLRSIFSSPEDPGVPLFDVLRRHVDAKTLYNLLQPIAERFGAGSSPEQVFSTVIRRCREITDAGLKLRVNPEFEEGSDLVWWKSPTASFDPLAWSSDPYLTAIALEKAPIQPNFTRGLGVSPQEHLLNLRGLCALLRGEKTSESMQAFNRCLDAVEYQSWFNEEQMGLGFAAYAVAHGRPEWVSELMEKGFSPTAPYQGASALGWAIINNDVSTLNALESAGLPTLAPQERWPVAVEHRLGATTDAKAGYPVPEDYGHQRIPPLVMAAYLGNYDVFHHLLQNASDAGGLNMAPIGGLDAFHVLARRRDYPKNLIAMEALLAFGGSPSPDPQEFYPHEYFPNHDDDLAVLFREHMPRIDALYDKIEATISSPELRGNDFTTRRSHDLAAAALGEQFLPGVASRPSKIGNGLRLKKHGDDFLKRRFQDLTSHMKVQPPVQEGGNLEKALDSKEEPPVSSVVVAIQSRPKPVKPT